MYGQIQYAHFYYNYQESIIIEITINDGLYKCQREYTDICVLLNNLCKELCQRYEELGNTKSVEIFLLNENDMEQVLLVSKNGVIDFCLEDYYHFGWEEDERDRSY